MLKILLLAILFFPMIQSCGNEAASTLSSNTTKLTTLTGIAVNITPSNSDDPVDWHYGVKANGKVIEVDFATNYLLPQIQQNLGKKVVVTGVISKNKLLIAQTITSAP